MRNLKGFLVAAASLLALAGCAGMPGSAPAPIATIQPGDDQLSCQQLTTQMGQMDQIIANTAGANTAGLGNTALSAASQSAGALSGTQQILANLATDGASTLSANSAQSQATQNMQASQRKNHLMALYTQKKC